MKLIRFVVYNYDRLTHIALLNKFRKVFSVTCAISSLFSVKPANKINLSVCYNCYLIKHYVNTGFIKKAFHT